MSLKRGPTLGLDVGSLSCDGWAIENAEETYLEPDSMSLHPAVSSASHSDEEREKLDRQLFSVPPWERQDSCQNLLLTANSWKESPGGKPGVSVPPEPFFYAHLQQLHRHWHTHPISFSFDFEPMNKVKRMLIFQKGRKWKQRTNTPSALSFNQKR